MIEDCGRSSESFSANMAAEIPAPIMQISLSYAGMELSP
jgi:hypothetical protein